MQNEALQDPTQYAGQVAKQIEQYQETEQMHDLPRIYDYWAKKYNSPRIASVIGYDNLTTFMPRISGSPCMNQTVFF